MVHALEEIRQILAPDGILIDLRPIAANWPIEVVSRRERRLAGRVADSAEDLENDAAANQSLTVAAERGWFVREDEQTFPFNYYWDSPEQMATYVKEEWGDFAYLDEDVLKKTRSLWTVADADARVRIQLDMLITRWRRAA